MKRLVPLALLSALLSTVVMTAEVRADGYVETTGSYTEGASIRGDRYTTAGELKVSGGAETGLLTSLLAILTDVWDDASNFLRVSLATLISGEDQANNLLMTSGGVVRIATLGSVTSQAATSIPAIIPTGAKALMGQIINATSETKAVTAIVYGNWTNSTTGGIEICQIELPSTVTTLQLQGLCPISVNAIPFNWWYYKTPVYTSTSLAPFTIWPMF